MSSILKDNSCVVLYTLSPDSYSATRLDMLNGVCAVGFDVVRLIVRRDV